MLIDATRTGTETRGEDLRAVLVVAEEEMMARDMDPESIRWERSRLIRMIGGESPTPCDGRGPCGAEHVHDGATAEEDHESHLCAECLRYTPGEHTGMGGRCDVCLMAEELRGLSSELSQHRALMQARWGGDFDEAIFQAAVTIVEQEREEEE